MATPSSDKEEAALANYGAGNRFTPNTPLTPALPAAATAGGRGPPGGPSPYALQQARKGLTLADIRRRNLDEQQALRDEGHLRRYRVCAINTQHARCIWGISWPFRAVEYVLGR